jgi:hypothetical protein
MDDTSQVECPESADAIHVPSSPERECDRDITVEILRAARRSSGVALARARSALGGAPQVAAVDGARRCVPRTAR